MAASDCLPALGNRFPFSEVRSHSGTPAGPEKTLADNQPAPLQPDLPLLLSISLLLSSTLPIIPLSHCIRFYLQEVSGENPLFKMSTLRVDNHYSEGGQFRNAQSHKQQLIPYYGWLPLSVAANIPQLTSPQVITRLRETPVMAILLALTVLSLTGDVALKVAANEN
jgi:hypothetical protein